MRYWTHTPRDSRTRIKFWLHRLLLSARRLLLGRAAPPDKMPDNRRISGGERPDKTPVVASAVEPDVFHAPAIVLAVHHDGQPLNLGLIAGAKPRVVDDRPGTVLLQLPIDVPDQFPARVLVGCGRPFAEQLL